MQFFALSSDYIIVCIDSASFIFSGQYTVHERQL